MQVLDHHRRVAGGEGGQGLPPGRVVEFGLVGLLAQVVVDDVPPSRPARAGRSRCCGRTDPGRSRAGSRSAGPVGGPDDQDVGRDVTSACRRRRWAGSQELIAVDEPALDPQGRCGVCSKDCSWISSSLTTPGMPSPWRWPAAPGAADGIELLDEPDGAALPPGVLAQGLEVGADLAVGLAVEHGLEGRRRDEQERHAGLGGHGLGHVGLAGARAGPRTGWPCGGSRPSARRRCGGRGTG